MKKGIDPNHNGELMPFHGDKYTLQVVDDIVSRSKLFLETGSGWGDTIYWMGNKYPDLNCITCDSDTKRAKAVTELTFDLDNVNVLECDSIDLLSTQKMGNESVIFWLDAHGQFINENGKKIIVDPVREELDYIFRNYEDSTIFIDDFKNPFSHRFAFDVLKNGPLSVKYIKDLIPNDYKMYCPCYKERSCLEPCQKNVIGVGWCVITKKELKYDFLKQVKL